jgi:hypothetical protein
MGAGMNDEIVGGKAGRKHIVERDRVVPVDRDQCIRRVGTALRHMLIDPGIQVVGRDHRVEVDMVRAVLEVRDDIIAQMICKNEVVTA